MGVRRRHHPAIQRRDYVETGFGFDRVEIYARGGLKGAEWSFKLV